MKVDKIVLSEVLQKKWNVIDNTLPKTVRKDIEKYLVNKYNMKYGDVSDLLNQRYPLETQPDDYLFKFTKAVYEVMSKSKHDIQISELDIDKYFTDVNIKQFDMPVPEVKIDNRMIFEEWFMVNPDQWYTKKSIDDVYRWMLINRLKYDPKVQRDLIVKETNGIKVKIIDFNDQAGKEIFDSMKDNKFISDVITINIDPDLYPAPEVIDGKLVIPESTIVSLIDGFHRYWEMCMVKKSYPNWKYTTVINLTMFRVEKANDYMIQQDKKTHFREEKLDKLDKRSEAYFLATKLNDSNKFNLQGTLLDDSEIKGFVISNLKKMFGLRTISREEFAVERPKTLQLYDIIESNINYLIESKNMFGKEIDQSKWFIYLYLIKLCINAKFDFKLLIDKLDLTELEEQVNIKLKPNKSHYNIVEGKFKEVMQNATVL